MPRFCFIIPCYNEADRLDTPAFSGFIQEHADVDFWFVNDGSTDHTEEVLNALSRMHPNRIGVVSQSPNKGKAEAVRIGMLLATDQPYDYIGFMDADLATPLSQIKLFQQVLAERPETNIVLGSRIQRLGARIERRAVRHYVGRIFATLASEILHLPVYDTQCGAKLFSRSCVATLFSQPFSSRWIFDVELLARYVSQIGTQGLIEVPLLEWYERGGSKIRLRHLVRLPIELWKIRQQMNL